MIKARFHQKMNTKCSFSNKHRKLSVKSNIRLIGFKLLVDVSKKELLTVARASLIKNKAEIIVANDLYDISNNQHHAYLVKENSVIEATTKEEIAQLLLTHIHAKDNL